ncbi:tol-pal system protein YbgF [Microbulbifer sp. 2205BS26-8]|uniref:tol-pal system protein YbgF n=1 Tax=Microbulbifer sp. 2205BS26-8 TaxID=3064386 RepID=UPI00273FFA26|nr:tol-pal system protein YbgF [Microbulbifer sp. 2205BS26-8]MDP5210730.1 tol-pal system protein YbgF [Microbulbifer sp. 2205BS26-8]
MALTIRKLAIAAAALLVASPVFSQVPVVDLSASREERSSSSDDISTQGPKLARSTTTGSRTKTNPQAELYYQMQVLQQEVQSLRGTVEEMLHEIKRLKQQRTEDYMDLDRRITRLSGTTPSAEADDGTSARDDSSVSSMPREAKTGGNERDRYQASFGLARNGDYGGASAEFKRLLQDYPNGQYAPNANYWLGEIALVQGDLEEAREWFVALLDGYPNSSKVWDGRYKLGTVYHQLGDQQKARALLEQVAASDARASNLAQKYLKENFQ